MKTVSLAPVLLCGLVTAQSHVSPAHFAHSEGVSQNSFPFGIATVPFRFSQVHDDVPNMTIRGMVFRHNAGNVNGTVYPAHSITMDAWYSTAVTTSATMSTTFDNNHGLDKIRVVTNRTYNLPASDPADVPGQFLLDYPLDVPFVFAGGGASLCWEVQITGKTQAVSIFYDAMNPPNADPPLQVTRVYTGCLATGATNPMMATPQSSMTWTVGTGVHTVIGANLLANGTVLFVTGFSRTQWAGIPLPIQVPGSTGAPSGTCNIHTDVAVIIPRLATATGAVTNRINVPATPDLNGLTTYSQIWGIDPAANPTGITTSNMVVHNFLAPYLQQPVGRVSLSGSLGAVGNQTGVTSGCLPTLFY
jgi:hypothetical protein